jgi:phosphatidylserine decarboxylase
MTAAPALVFYDRERGSFHTEKVHARGVLRWLYNSRSGGLLARVLVGTPLFSRLWGALHRTRWSRRRIRPFVEQMGIDMSESAKDVDEFASFNDFFVRALRPGTRPVCPEPDVLAAPVDGKVLAYPRVEARTSFRIKRAVFDLEGLLGDATLAATFAGGSMLVCRLGLADHHHFHFPDSGTPGPARAIAGRYHAGGPYAERTLVPFFAENHRMVTLFDSDHFGPMAIVEVGALTVGSIRQRFRPGARVEKGAPKGWFELGGSTVVLLFREGAIALDPEMCALTAREIECYVRMGRPLGRRAADRPDRLSSEDACPRPVA